MQESGGQDGLSASLEDYLETIYVLVSKNKSARVTDISSRMGVSKSSVTGALRTLSGKSLINYTPYGLITLTEYGERLAKQVFDWHSSIRDFLIKYLMVEEDVADETACALEHCIPREVVAKMAGLLNFAEAHPDEYSRLQEALRNYLNRDG